MLPEKINKSCTHRSASLASFLTLMILIWSQRHWVPPTTVSRCKSFIWTASRKGRCGVSSVPYVNADRRAFSRTQVRLLFVVFSRFLPLEKRFLFYESLYQLTLKMWSALGCLSDGPTTNDTVSYETTWCACNRFLFLCFCIFQSFLCSSWCSEREF